VDALTSPSISSRSSLQIIYELEATPPVTADAGVRKSMQPSGLAQQLSHKLSTTFGNPTVVHRPKLRTRPSVMSLSGNPKVVGDDLAIRPAAGSFVSPAKSPTYEQQLSPQDDTDPSSYNNSGSVSPGDRSTGKTSVDSAIASVRSQGKAEETSREKPLTPIDEIPIERDDNTVTPKPYQRPTIVTVEMTANAKVFFETFFNDVLSEQASPRSLRRKELELRLQAESLSTEQRQHELYTWASRESDHLRQNRVLKSKTNRMTGSTGADIAGFQVVRILGKGSFGVVRLVREKDESSMATHARSNAINVFRSPFDVQTSISRDSRKSKKQVYAMKVIRKSDMLRNSQEGHLRAERDFLVASEKSRWVVPLIASFQDWTNLYLVMEYMVGGDFLGLLFRKDILKEKKARWYIAEMILCVEEAHRLRWIHRDVKPDNFLISASGHLKISDFGLAFDGHWAHDQSFFANHRLSLMEKLGIEVDGDSIDRKEGASIAASMAIADIVTSGKRRDKIQLIETPGENETILQWRNRIGKRKLARSVVGTSQYMAPEVIRGELYDGRCDWWSIGIILYEVCLIRHNCCR
jgi:protein-serine/threonine kinase